MWNNIQRYTFQRGVKKNAKREAIELFKNFLSCISWARGGSLKMKRKRTSQTFRAASLVVQRSADNWFAAEKGRVSWANSKVSSAKIINHGADKDRRYWQARIGFTRHAAFSGARGNGYAGGAGGEIEGCHLEYVRLMVGYLTQKRTREDERRRIGVTNLEKWRVTRDRHRGGRMSLHSLCLSFFLGHRRLRHRAANWLPIGRW